MLFGEVGFSLNIKMKYKTTHWKLQGAYLKITKQILLEGLLGVVHLLQVTSSSYFQTQ